jgi:hypothetical protein
MSFVMPRLLYVSATDPDAVSTSITTALRQAVPGDTVVVGAGQYSPSRTGEHFPLYVPPEVTLTGAGAEQSIIDGEGAMDLSFRPVQAGQSLVLLGHGSTLSNLTITQSGGNGIGIQPGARVLIMRNTIRQHGQHGIIVSGPEEAIIKDNRFEDNGTRAFRPETPRPAAGRQGHHIFVQGKAGAANRILIADNTMRGAFADAVALVVFFDEADGVNMHASILNNRLEESQRRGLIIAGSFAPSHTRVTLDIRHNVMQHNASQAIAALAARPLALQLIRGCKLRLQLIENECRNNGEGILLCSGFGPAEDNLLESMIVGNTISGTQRHAFRLIGGVGLGGYAAHHNRVRAVLSRNHLEDIGDTPVFVQGGASENHEDVSANQALVQLLNNTLPLVAGKPAVLLNDGLPGNTAHVLAPAPRHARIDQPMPYQA